LPAGFAIAFSPEEAAESGEGAKEVADRLEGLARLEHRRQRGQPSRRNDSVGALLVSAIRVRNLFPLAAFLSGAALAAERTRRVEVLTAALP
jgi:hypothetical protein